MFHHIKGTLIKSTPTQAVIETGGVGYLLTISLSTKEKLTAQGSECMLLCHFSVSENAQNLYGFASEEERTLFRALISVSGVGPATGMQILSGTSPEEFARAVENQDHTALKKIKGIGEKTAKRIIVELKGIAAISMLGASAGQGSVAPASDTASAAKRALETLGVNPREASTRVEKVLSKNPDIALEELIKLALQ
ncbi:MAG: Holliday junction branch migration protein RuvA [Planctomycetota bacterium]|jgi:Holliday junction DNA helicase RuvA